MLNPNTMQRPVQLYGFSMNKKKNFTHFWITKNQFNDWLIQTKETNKTSISCGPFFIPDC